MTARKSQPALHFNPLPPYGGRRHDISHLRSSRQFQSTPSVWRETQGNLRYTSSLEISIHSLRMEGDLVPHLSISDRCHFNPLPPYGGRHTGKTLLFPKFHFNPLPPYGGRRNSDFSSEMSTLFQSTPSVWRETLLVYCAPAQYFTFQSTPSVWRETTWRRIFCGFWDISIHSLRMEGDLKPPMSINFVMTFQSTPSVWRETLRRLWNP